MAVSSKFEKGDRILLKRWGHHPVDGSWQIEGIRAAKIVDCDKLNKLPNSHPPWITVEHLDSGRLSNLDFYYYIVYGMKI